MKSPIEEPRTVTVDVPARIKIMQNAKMDSISIAQMIDPLTQSEVARLEERVIGLEKQLSFFTNFMDQFLTYKEVTERLAEELAVYHKLGILQGDTIKETGEVLKITASVFGVSAKELLSRQRPAHIAIPRMVCMYIFRTRLGMTLNQIGNFFKRDHATAMHAMAVITKLFAIRKPDAQKAKLIAQIRNIESLVPKINPLEDSK